MKVILTLIFIVSVIFTAIIIIRNRGQVDGVVSILKETSITSLFGVLLWIEAILIIYIVWMYPDAWLNSRNAYINTFIFVTLGSVLGGFSFLFSIVKKSVATKSTLISISPFGKRTSIKWRDIKKIEKPSKNRLKFITNNQSIVVYGPKNNYNQFVIDIEPLLSSKIKNEI